MPDRDHPANEHQQSSTSSRPTGAPFDDPFEQLLRSRLHQLADHAPATVHTLDEVRVEHDRRRVLRGERRPEPRRRRTAGIGATIAALAGAIGVTTVALTGAGTAGAASPEEAVQAFLSAARAEDVFGMIDTMDPLEVPAARSGVERGRADAVEADVVSEGFQLDGIDGVDLELADLGYTTEAVTAGVSVVEVGGAVSLRFDPAAFPFGDALAEALEPDLAAVAEDADLSELFGGDLPAMLATVERDGRWYVSASYTIGEYARRAADLPVPAAPITPVGAASPEEAADRFWASMLDLDVASMVSLAAPGEGDALLTYGPLIVDASDESVNPLRGDGFRLSFVDAVHEVTGTGERRVVRAPGFRVEGTVPDQDAWGYLDPTLPTVISTWDGSGIVVLDAGVPIPATLEGYEVDTDLAYPDGAANYTMENEDGTVQPLPEKPASSGPDDITIERADGCTTYRGPGAVNLLGASSTSTQADGSVVVETVGPSGAGFEQIGDDVWRSCDGFDGLSAVLNLFGIGGLAELPSIEVVEVDGVWYVSPIGTVAEQLLGLLERGPDESLFDTPLSLLVLGADRHTLRSMLTGEALTSLSEECRPLAVAGSDGIVTGIVDDPDLGEVRRCATGAVYSDAAFDGVVTEEMPSPVASGSSDPTVVEAEVVPASTLP